MVTGVLYTVSAPSGAGKTSLVQALVSEDAGIDLSVSHTTRARREGEVDGRDYHFVAEAEFRRMIDAADFIEHARVFGNLYGTSEGAVRQQLLAGRDVLLEIDWQGARQVKHGFRTPWRCLFCHLRARPWSGGCWAGGRIPRKR